MFFLNVVSILDTKWFCSSLNIKFMKACFMGLGYIGLPTAIIAAKYGIEVIGVDINPKVVEMTNQGKLHIIEPGMEELLQEVVNNGQLKASTVPEVADAYFMVVQAFNCPLFTTS